MIKKIFLGLCTLALIASCENSEQSFDDYDVQTVYFPIQYPVRTIALGESRTDNSIDLEHAFSIGACIGGMYSNPSERIIDIKLAPELADGISTSTGNQIKVLPSDYYEAIDFDQIVIPEGSFNGTIRIDLTDAFFQDTLSKGVNYVLPLMISESTKDSILSGVTYPELEGIADVRKPEEWLPGFEPKNYTLFAVKYINSKDGMYFYRGTNYEMSGSDIVSETSYSEKYLTENLQEQLSTESLTECTLARVGGQIADELKINLTFDDDNKTISISQTTDGVTIPVSGSGSFLNADDEGAEVWSSVGHRTLFLDYEYTYDGKTFHAMDTLVYRDNNMSYEEFSIVFNEE